MIRIIQQCYMWITCSNIHKRNMRISISQTTLHRISFMEQGISMKLSENNLLNIKWFSTNTACYRFIPCVRIYNVWLHTNLTLSYFLKTLKVHKKTLRNCNQFCDERRKKKASEKHFQATRYSEIFRCRIISDWRCIIGKIITLLHNNRLIAIIVIIENEMWLILRLSMRRVREIFL